MNEILKRLFSVYRSSGKGILGLSKTFVGIIVVFCMLIGQDQIAKAFQDNQKQAVELLTKLIAFGGLFVTVYGAGDKQNKLDKVNTPLKDGPTN